MCRIIVTAVEIRSGYLMEFSIPIYKFICFAKGMGSDLSVGDVVL